MKNERRELPLPVFMDTRVYATPGQTTFAWWNPPGSRPVKVELLKGGGDTAAIRYDGIKTRVPRNQLVAMLDLKR